MADMPGPNETRLNLIDGVEYITLRADDFRTTLRVSDAVHKAEMSTLRAEIERLKQGSDTMGPLEYIAYLRAENEWLRAEREDLHAHVGELQELLAELSQAYRDRDRAEDAGNEAENERLRQKLSDSEAASTGFRLQRDQAEVENERLRAAVTAVYLAKDADRGAALERLFDLVVGPSDEHLSG